MKILLLYTARSGSTSILNYFSKIKPEYECFCDPWYNWHTSDKINYNDLICRDNIFVKSTYNFLPVTIEQAVADFDKVIILLRRDLKEQVESSILAFKENKYLDTTKRKYAVYTITEEELSDSVDIFTLLNKTLREISNVYGKPLFYYEDLFYEDFTPMLEELNIEKHPIYFDELLNNSNRYRIGVAEIKEINTLI